MIATDAINLNVFQGMNVNKLFLTENTFTRSAIVNTLNTGQAGFLYVMAHGGVDRWGTYQETNPYITSDDVLACPENLHLPIVVSVACMAGASDTSLARPYWIKKGQTSFGEAVLFSAGAGIAYVGTTRATLGSPELYLDNGEVVITKERGIAGMLTYFFEAYHNNITTLGDITYSALETYVTKNMFSANPEKDEAFVVLVSFTLLGDPALQLPVPQPQTRPSYSVPHLIALDYEGITSETNPRPWYYTNTTISIQITTDSPEIVVKRINIDNDLVVDRQTLAVENNSVVYSFTSGQPARYLIRASSQDGKEGWLYCTASP